MRETGDRFPLVDQAACKEEYLYATHNALLLLD
jgi:hypothetical protein